MKKISIITVVLNAESLIEDTIKSVINQSYKNIELIIIDGKSEDKTLDIINKYKNNINILISEKDNGIYDAMNKGIINSSGDWLFFLNAGDILFDKHILNTLINNLDDNTDIIYGDIILVDKNLENKQYLKAKGIDSIWEHPPCWHQGMLSKTSLHKAKLFNLRYKTCSDYDFMVSSYNKGASFQYINIPFSYYLRGGMSTSEIFENRLEGLAITSQYIPQIRDLKTNFFYEDSIHHYNEGNKFSSSLKEQPKILANFHNILEELKMQYKKIAIYGLGTTGKLIAHFLEKKLTVICDKDVAIKDNNFPICTPSNLKEIDFDIIIISLIGREDSICQDLISIGINNNKIINLSKYLLNNTLNFNNTKNNSSLESGICTQEQLESDTYEEWIKYFKMDVKFKRRKFWEFAFIAEALKNRNLLKEKKKGLGFAVGEEPLVASFCNFGATILATDLNFEKAKDKGWVQTNQHSSNLNSLNIKNICKEEKFQELCTFKYVDMNNISDKLKNFDFLWSACALEHLGSISSGEKFIYESLKCLKPGGIAVHTTEYNYSSNTQTIESGPTVLFRKRDIKRIVKNLEKKGHKVEKINYKGGTLPLDKFVDFPPYNQKTHLKLFFAKYVITSIGLIITKKL